jgi:hypothetical protein
LIVSIPILQALISTGEPTYLIMRSPAQYGLADYIDGLSGSLKESEFDPEALQPTDKFYNFRNHPLQTDFVWGSIEFEERYPGYRINDVLKGICLDWGIQADFESLKPLSFTRRNDCADRIILIPGSAGLFKCWPAAHWIELAHGFKESGHQVAVVGQPERSAVVSAVLDSGIEHISTPTLKDALDVVSSSAGAVSVDTGLMHLCVHQGIPTVALFRYNTMFLRPYSRTRNLIGPLCPKECRDQEYAGAPNERIEYKVWQLWEAMTCALDDPDEHCMAKIQPMQVLESMMELKAQESRLDQLNR